MFETGGFGDFKEGDLSSLWYRTIVLLSKAELRRGRICASLSTAEDGDMSLEEAQVAVSRY